MHEADGRQNLHFLFDDWLPKRQPFEYEYDHEHEASALSEMTYKGLG